MNDLSIYDRFQNPGQFIAEMGKAICLSGMFGVENASQGQVMALECASRHMPPMSLAERYNCIKGKLSMKTDAMLADFHALGGRHVIQSRTPEEAVVLLSINGQLQRFSLSWTEAQQEPFIYVGKEEPIARKLQTGKTDGLTIKPKYATPRARMQMLWARVVSDGVRAMAPEVVAGHYTPEEIGDFDGVDAAAGPAAEIVVDVEPVAPLIKYGDTTAHEKAVLDTMQRELDREPAKAEAPPAEAPPVEAAPLEEPAPPAKSPIVLGGGDATCVNDSDPCGVDVAEEIIALAKQLAMPIEVLAAINTKHNIHGLSELPFGVATKLLEKLRQKASDADIPF